MHTADAWPIACERVHGLADHVRHLGMEVGLGVYGDTFLGAVEGTLRFYEGVDHPAAGIPRHRVAASRGPGKALPGAPRAAARGSCRGEVPCSAT